MGSIPIGVTPFKIPATLIASATDFVGIFFLADGSAEHQTAEDLEKKKAAMRFIAACVVFGSVALLPILVVGRR